MFKAEEIESWNEIFVGGKIQESDLKHPTEGFLVRTLIAYLKLFGYNVDHPVAAEGSREKRMFLVRLAQNIDRMLKFTNRSYTFFYYDLVEPVPKKTSHVLGILLNYYYYYNMFKKDVFAMANGRIDAHKEILHKIQVTQQENQERKDRAEQIDKDIASISKTVPAVKAELDAWNIKKTKQEEQLQKEHESVVALNKKIADLRTQERNLKKQIVENEEALKLKSELTDLQQNIQELLATKQNIETILNERMDAIKDLENLLKRLEEAKNMFLSKLLTDYKELTKKLKQSKPQYESILQKKMTLLDVIAKQETELKDMEEKFNNKRQQFEHEKMRKYALINENEALCSSKQQELKDLKTQLEHDNNQLEEQTQMRVFLQDAVRNIMSYYNAVE